MIFDKCHSFHLNILSINLRSDRSVLNTAMVLIYNSHALKQLNNSSDANFDLDHQQVPYLQYTEKYLHKTIR